MTTLSREECGATSPRRDLQREPLERASTVLSTCACRPLRRLQRRGESLEPPPDDVIPIHPGFRMVVLANRPGFPFLGNDFFRECGDVFATLVVATPDVELETGPHKGASTVNFKL